MGIENGPFDTQQSNNGDSDWAHLNKISEKFVEDEKVRKEKAIQNKDKPGKKFVDSTPEWAKHIEDEEVKKAKKEPREKFVNQTPEWAKPK